MIGGFVIGTVVDVVVVDCNRKRIVFLKRLVYTVWVYLKAVITEKTIKEELN